VPRPHSCRLMSYSFLAIMRLTSTVVPMDDELSISEPMTAESVTVYLDATQPLPVDECWHVSEYAPGWFSVVARKTGPDWQQHLRWGGLQFCGPGFVCLNLSSNPNIHDFDVCHQVLSENSTAPVDVDELRREILRRTQEGSEARPRGH
jgi:hypothetical protein